MKENDDNLEENIVRVNNDKEILFRKKGEIGYKVKNYIKTYETDYYELFDKVFDFVTKKY